MNIREIQQTIQLVLSGEDLFFLFEDEITAEVARQGFEPEVVEACYPEMIAQGHIIPCDDDKGLPAYMLGIPLDG